MLTSIFFFLLSPSLMGCKSHPVTIDFECLNKADTFLLNGINSHILYPTLLSVYLLNLCKIG